ncbi:MAG: DUF3106 domain-containing protein [Thermodesulfobacteriota bacterium]
MARPIRIASALLAVLTVAALEGSVAEARPRGRPDRMARNWEEMNAEERQKALRNFQRYQSLPESSRRRMDQSYESYKRLDPRERDRVQRNYQKYRQMSPDQRRSFEQKYKRWKGDKKR